jgi:hypothetical protein
VLSPLHVSLFESLVCRCGERLLVPQGLDATLSEWRQSAATEAWVATHREHAGCTGISIMPNARRRLEEINPDQVALTMIEELAIYETPIWRDQPPERRKAARQAHLARLITELKTYLIGTVP